MSTTDLDTTTTAADPELKTYRGKTLEELLPKIREELGPDALVVRQRDGLMGGIGGFFQQQFVEVDAKAGHPRIDVYDEPPAPSVADDFAGLLAAAAAEADFTALEPPVAEPPVAEPPVIEPPAPDLLAALEPPTSAPAPTPTEPKPAARRKPAARKPAAKRKPAPQRAATAADPADALVVALVAHGLGEQLAARLVADALVHELPFVPKGDRRIAVRRALAHRIPLVPARRAGGSAVAFVGAGGAGKTRCVVGLATAYARAGHVPVLCLALAPEDGGAALRRALEPTGVELEVVATTAAARTRIERAPADAVVVLDTPAVSPGDPAGVAGLAAQLAPLGLDEVQLVVPATIAPAAAQELQERLAPLKPSGITLSHADATSHLGTVVELACSTRLPLAYVAAREQFAPVDPHAIAERLLP